MKVNDCKSQWSPALNAKIMRGIERLVCDFRDVLPKGWRCLIEFQDNDEKVPNYQLDIESNEGGGSFAPVKMQMLKLFPDLSATGTASLKMIADKVTAAECPGELFSRLVVMHDVSELTEDDWAELKPLGMTHWYGGIRVPYDILYTKPAEDVENTECETKDQEVQRVLGEIRITFSGAREWQDTFFCFRLFQKIQVILNEMWSDDQIWYNLRNLKKDSALKFWVEALGVQEAPER